MSTPENLLDFVGRLMMSAIFLVVGMQQALNLETTRAYMDMHGVMSAFLPVAIILEVAGAIAIVIGYRTRIFAFLLAGFSTMTAVLFHAEVGNPAEFGLFVRDLALAGGMLVLCARGPGDWTLDARGAAASLRVAPG
jgi:putative oxidoreductase